MSPARFIMGTIFLVIYMYYISRDISIEHPNVQCGARFARPTTVIQMFEIVEILDGRVGRRSVELVRYAINNLLHFVIVKYGVIS